MSSVKSDTVSLSRLLFNYRDLNSLFSLHLNGYEVRKSFEIWSKYVQSFNGCVPLQLSPAVV